MLAALSARNMPAAADAMSASAVACVVERNRTARSRTQQKLSQTLYEVCLCTPVCT